MTISLIFQHTLFLFIEAQEREKEERRGRINGGGEKDLEELQYVKEFMGMLEVKANVHFKTFEYQFH